MGRRGGIARGLAADHGGVRIRREAGREHAEPQICAVGSAWLPAQLDAERDHHAGVRRVLSLVPNRHIDALRAQAFGVGALLRVGARHFIAEVLHDGGDARHADAANAHEMDRADIERE